ncbi:hypothetical protein SNEBB_011155 [Seison nebaliae]|nr:hypothetical protein SNEBB_011155 [Seison nebaliae]
MSSELSWEIIKNNHAFLMKRNRQFFSKESMNVLNRNTFRYNGLVHPKAISVHDGRKNKSGSLVTVTKRNQKLVNKPAVSTSVIARHRNSSTVNSRKILHKVNKRMVEEDYRTDLRRPVLRRVTKICRSKAGKSASSK